MPRAEAFLRVIHSTMAQEKPAAAVARLTQDPLGVKGCGEAGAIASPAAIMNAVNNALEPFGVKHVQMPATSLNVWQAIQAAGASLRYLPPYSPEFNPIELVFHPVKALLRKAAERTIEGLERCVCSFIRALKPSECMGYFRHAGYEPL